MSVFALVNNEKITVGPRVSIFSPKGDDEGECICCKKTVKYHDESKLLGESLVDVACGFDCAQQVGWLIKIPILEEDKSDNDDKNNSSSAKKVRVVSSEIKQVKVKRFCPSCGGPASRGRGCFAHKPDCEDHQKLLHDRAEAAIKKQHQQSNAKTFCPSCNGPARGKGFTHKDGCAASQKMVEDRAVKMFEKTLARMKAKSGT